MIDFARDLLGAGLQQARGLAPWQELAGACDRAARDLRIAAAGPVARRARHAQAALERAQRAATTSRARSAACGEACEAAAAGLTLVVEMSPDFAKLAERATQLAALAERFGAPAEDGNVRWIDVSPHQARLVESPLDIRDALREQMVAAPKAWVFTSATLGDDERLSWFTESAGLDRRAHPAPGQPVRLRGACAAVRAARLPEAQRAGPCGRRSRCSRRAARARSAGAPSC